MPNAKSVDNDGCFETDRQRAKVPFGLCLAFVWVRELAVGGFTTNNYRRQVRIQLSKKVLQLTEVCQLGASTVCAPGLALGGDFCLWQEGTWGNPLIVWQESEEEGAVVRGFTCHVRITCHVHITWKVGTGKGSREGRDKEGMEIKKK
jgi:hypothetical protein